MLRRHPRRLAGVSLAEMLAVVAILGLVAAIAIPQASSVTPQVADAAAAEVAHAIRFAQREAMRTGLYHVAEIDPATQTIRVFRLVSLASGAEDTDQPVMHPVDKQPYRINLAAQAARAVVTGSVFTYGADKTDDIAFGADGAPVKYAAGTAPTAPLSADGIVSLQSGAALRTVTVDKTTGRVTL
jgi:Tfp pilus assembly protein FimT